MNFFSILWIFFLIPHLVFAGSKTLVFCAEGSPRYFNPQLATDGPSMQATRDVYDSLLVLDPKDSSHIIPVLAHSYKVSKDGLKYTFYLRKGVAFHKTTSFKPKRNFNADDVLFSFNRMFDEKHPFHGIAAGKYQYFEVMDLKKTVKKLSKISPYIVEFELYKPSSTFVISMAMQFTGILSKEYADQIIRKGESMDNIDNRSVGTGPFKIVKYVKDSFIRYKRHKDYFGKRPQLNQIIFSITPDASVRLQKLKRGECQVSSYPSPSDIPSILKHKKLKLLKREIFDISYLGMNVQKPYLNNVKVRKAIRYALNRDLYIKAIYKGYAVKAKSAMPSTMWGHNDQLPNYDYSIRKAKRLMREAGYSKGFDIKLWTLPISRPYNPSGKKMGELMQADLAKINIRVHLKSFDWVTYLSKIEKGEQELFQLGWLSDNGDPDNFLGTLLTCKAIQARTNSARWCNKKYDKLINKAVATLDQKERAKLYKQAQVIFSQHSPWAPLVHTIGYRSVRKNVHNYIVPSFGMDPLYNIQLK